MTQIIRAVWAQDNNGLIGVNRQLPWSNRDDLKYFKNLTSDSVVIMGYNTYKSIGEKGLPNRINIVVSRKTTIINNGYETVILVNSIEKAIEVASKYEKDVNIIGGAQIYKLAEPYVNECSRTIIEGEYSGDTYFPDIFQDFEVEKEDIFDGRKVQILKKRV